jgi:hypothetical protein
VVFALLRTFSTVSHSASPGPFRALAMDDLEQYAGAFLFLLIFARLAREVRGVLQPLARWPPGTSARDADGTFLTPEREFERWAKRGEPPGGKRLAVSLTAAMLALLCLPVWARTTWIRRASLPLRAIEAEANADSAALQFPPPALRVLAIANAAGAGADEDADTIWEALGDMRADAAGKHDARLELAVLSGDGRCVTRGRVETIDDDDDDDDDAGDSGTGKTERTDAETRRRAAEKQRRSPCCFGAAARELWTVPDADVDAWLARHEPRAHESCGAAEDANALFLLPSDGADVALVMGARRAAWVRFPAGGGRGRQTGAEKAADAARRAAPVAARYFKTGWPESSFRSPLFSVSGESRPESRDESAEESDARRARRARNAFPATRPDGAATLSFTLADAAPDRRGHSHSWRFARDVEARFARRAAAALARCVTLNVEGQVLRHAASRVASERAAWVEDARAFVLPRAELPFFVDTSSWNVDTSPADTTAPPTHLVAYVPPRDKCPLALESRLESDDAAGTAAAFDVPGWGGVVVWNPATCAGGDFSATPVTDAGEGVSSATSSDAPDAYESRPSEKPKRSSRGRVGRAPSLAAMTENVTAPAPTVLADEALEFVLSAFAASLRVAFGLPPAPPGAAVGGGDATVLDVGARGGHERAHGVRHTGHARRGEAADAHLRARAGRLRRVGGGRRRAPPRGGSGGGGAVDARGARGDRREPAGHARAGGARSGCRGGAALPARGARRRARRRFWREGFGARARRAPSRRVGVLPPRVHRRDVLPARVFDGGVRASLPADGDAAARRRHVGHEALPETPAVRGGVAARRAKRVRAGGESQGGVEGDARYDVVSLF